MAKILLGVTGSVAAIYTRQVFDDLRAAGHEVKIVATGSSLYFFNPTEISRGADGQRDRNLVILDEDEWPGQDEGVQYQRGDEVLHIELRRWADILLIAPLDANSLAKLALGTCDNCLTCVYRAWDRTRRVILAPAMNTLMWEHPATLRHLRQIAEDVSGLVVPANLEQVKLIDWINHNALNLRVAAPQTKKLACDDVGIGAMAERPALIRFIDG